MNPTLSTRQATIATGLSRESIRKVLKLHKHKMQILHELHDEDPDRRIEFCEIMTNRIIAEPRLGNLNGEMYADMLDRSIEPLIVQEFENQIDLDGNSSLDLD
ncbi:hypothetical protein ABEB36_000280 [Hypothenemus hampei]|uniref:Uncharacterized protein n=1 Tax=Hypothenemus hampei TaxID=57062 RepID=A0ABD1FAQ8_HYPHA